MAKSPEDVTGRVRHTVDAGMFTMMAAMTLCCLGVLLLVALIPILGWPLGIAVAVAGGAALMYAHFKLMGHGGNH